MAFIMLNRTKLLSLIYSISHKDASHYLMEENVSISYLMVHTNSLYKIAHDTSSQFPKIFSKMKTGNLSDIT